MAARASSFPATNRRISAQSSSSRILSQDGEEFRFRFGRSLPSNRHPFRQVAETYGTRRRLSIKTGAKILRILVDCLGLSPASGCILKMPKQEEVCTIHVSYD